MKGQAEQFISQVLSQRGPQAVPYDERHKWTIREHLSELLKMFPNLALKVSEFHTNDGRILHLVKAEGTIPIHYQAAKYNIPIVLWLPERYPLQAPLVYVCPTASMIIKAGHSFVDASGLVRSPCIAHWLHPSSDLSAVCQEAAMLFGAEPPLYTKPPGYVPPPPGAAGGMGPPSGSSSGPPSGGPASYQGFATQPPPQQQQQQQPQQPGLAQAAQHPSQGYLGQQQHGDAALAGHALWGGAYAAATSSSAARPPEPPQQQHQAFHPQQPLPPPPQQQQQQQQPAQQQQPVAQSGAGPSSSSGPYGMAAPPPNPKQLQVEQLKGEFQGLAARALAGRLQAGLEAYNRHAAEEMDALLEVQRTLLAREQQLQGVVSSIQQERLGTEGLVAQLGRSSAALESWLAAHEWKADAVTAALATGAGGEGGGLDINKVVVPADDLSRQALQCQAEDLAVEDCLLVLEKALLQGKLAPDAYMKQVRLLCRRQFLARALGLKVAAAQRAAPQQRTSHGSTGSGYAMTHGDTWSHR